MAWEMRQTGRLAYLKASSNIQMIYVALSQTLPNKEPYDWALK